MAPRRLARGGRRPARCRGRPRVGRAACRRRGVPGVPVEATEIDYVALGDSFTAGPLIPMAREDAPGCFRSTNNYPAYLAGLLDVATYRDASCSGASTADMAGRQSLMFDEPGAASAVRAVDEHRPGHRRPRRQRLRAVRLAVGRLRRLLEGCGDAVPGPFRRQQGARRPPGPRHAAGGPRAGHAAGAGRRGVRRRLPPAAPRIGLVPVGRLHCRGRRLGARHRRGCSTARSAGPRRLSGRRSSTSIRPPWATTSARVTRPGSTASGPTSGRRRPTTRSWWACARWPGSSIEAVTGEEAPPLEGSAAPAGGRGPAQPLTCPRPPT